ncbi:acyl-CoA dehydrogenase family protein [Mycobacterium decipiens]|uniref:Acyl-CoA dehydrogenase/oxidase C-terminal domain-containing protein n=1 Tax=Mycobacterium decipiens TaxID=1430326 RepID=A0A1X2LT15_9MYCO|nr:acyl-CoA dehydrogenase family protein [Mycobacterium decipiens]OSC39929.1 hypothetical protein B8W66_14765 [Mycobacterium decipiens]
MQLRFDADVEAFRAEFAAFLDRHLPALLGPAEGFERPRSCSHIPQWARRWQRLLFDNGWLLPGNTEEFGGRDVLLAFVRTDAKLPKHRGISVLLIPTDTPGVVRRPFASVCDINDVDFNEVFFTDVRVPVQNLVGPLNGGWRVATGSLGHERVMLWMGYADLLHQLTVDFSPSGVLERDRYATLVMDSQALRLLGSATLARAARGEEDVPAQSVLKLLGSEALQRACADALNAAGLDGLVHPAVTAPFAALNLDSHYGSWFDRYARTFAATIAGGTSEIQRNIIAERILDLPRNQPARN